MKKAITENRFDIVICIGKQHLAISSSTIKALLDLYEKSNIFIVTSGKNIDYYLSLFKTIKRIKIYDENSISSVSFENLQNYFKSRVGEVDRAGWYFQQFLKLAIHEKIDNQYYLVWDADTIPLRRINFFDEQKRIFIQTTNEYHKPYFELIEKVLKLEKQIEGSFISEHFMFDKQIVKELLKNIDNRKPGGWIWNILDNINDDDLRHSGFSEYETYGTFAISKYKEVFVERERIEKIKSYRFGSNLFGPTPSKNSLYLLKNLGYSYVTFEVWDNWSEEKIKKNNKLAFKYYVFANPFLKLLHPFSKYWLQKHILRKIEKQLIT